MNTMVNGRMEIFTDKEFSHLPEGKKNMKENLKTYIYLISV